MALLLDRLRERGGGRGHECHHHRLCLFYLRSSLIHEERRGQGERKVESLGRCGGKFRCLGLESPVGVVGDYDDKNDGIDGSSGEGEGEREREREKERERTI